MRRMREWKRERQNKNEKIWNNDKDREEMRSRERSGKSDR